MSILRQRTSVSTLLMLLPLLLAAGPDAKPAAPATQPVLNDGDPKALPSMFQDTDKSRSVVFLEDASGSMIGKMAMLKDQTNKSVVKLKPEQTFGIVIMQEKGCNQFSQKLEPANAAKKRSAGTFLDDALSTGVTDPIVGIDAAFALKPEMLYLVTDGDFPDNAAVLTKIRQLNKDKKVKVYTIAFVNQNDTDTAFIDLLKVIASENGGKYEHVNEGDL